ncbi:MAG: hypothetical protein WCZ65_09010 [Lysobacteraceae bacterium]
MKSLMLFVAAAFFLLSGHASSAALVQCESCTSQSLAASRVEGLKIPGEFYVFSLEAGVIFKVRRLAGKSGNPSPLPKAGEPVEAAVKEAFLQLLGAYRRNSPDFYAQSAFIAPIDAIGGPSDVVEISLAGEHSGKFSGFRNRFDLCVSDIACMEGVSTLIAALRQAEDTFQTSGLTLGLVDWEHAPAVFNRNVNTRIFLCDSHANCIKMELVNGSWLYRGVYADQGNGPRYPQPGEDLTYHSDDQGFEAFESGLRNAGVVLGERPAGRFSLRCAHVEGRLGHCEMTPKDSGEPSRKE